MKSRAKRSYNGPVCPRCAEPFADGIPATGNVACRKCRTVLTAIQFHPRNESGSQPLPAGEDAPCAQHLRNRAEASCERCGVFMCAVCRIDVDGRRLCPPCFERLSGEGVLPSAVVHRRNWCGMSIHAAVFGMLPFFGVVLVPLALWFAIAGLRQNYRTGERISHLTGWLAIVCSVIGAGIQVATISALIFAAGRH